MALRFSLPSFQVHALLAWANASPRGLLLFVDEAEAALPDRRAASGVSEVAQNVLNTFLYHTGAQSSQFMLVLATNRPSDLDEALLDRMDEVRRTGGIHAVIHIFLSARIA